jgi:hypothetical protein
MNASAGETKCVMVLDDRLSVGLAVNTAGVLALTLGKEIEAIIGEDVEDGSGTVHRGITTHPIPILKAPGELIKEIRLRAADADSLLIVDVTDAAQTTTTYDDYIRKIGSMSTDELSYLGIALYGDKKVVNRFTGSLPLLR